MPSVMVQMEKEESVALQVHPVKMEPMEPMEIQDSLVKKEKKVNQEKQEVPAQLVLQELQGQTEPLVLMEKILLTASLEMERRLTMLLSSIATILRLYWKIEDHIHGH